MNDGAHRMNQMGTAPELTATTHPLEEATHLTRSRRTAAWAIALAADLAQIVLMPLFGGGATSPLNNALDVGVALALTYLVGFHWSFVPSLIAESLPLVDLAPTWTAAMFLASRK